MNNNIEEQSINTIRAIALDSVNKAQSGHTGTAMSLAPLAHLLFTKIMNYDNTDTQWINRDRFILSGGHVSILHYAMLYLTNTGLTLEDLQNFRQLDSDTPGHPEVGHTKGIEYTTGPLGQGFANAVGCAISEAHLRSEFGKEIIDHNIYVTCGDGDLQEGVTHEAASLAGHLGLGKLIVFYDDNHISIDGDTELSFSENVAKRFEAYNWHVQDIGENGENLDVIEDAISNAKEDERPSLIIIRTHIAYPSDKYLDTPHGHGAILDDEEILKVKEKFGFSSQPFDYPSDVLSFYQEKIEERKVAKQIWDKNLAELEQSNNQLFEQFQNTINQKLLKPYVAKKYENGEQIPTRVAINDCLNQTNEITNSLIGGSADLTGNTGCKLENEKGFNVDPKSNQIFFGIREHGMGSIGVGISLAHGLIPFVGTFFVFSDFMKPSLRMAAFSNSRMAFIFTHDSIGVGEDGPTHQPVEQLATLRVIPNLTTWRPCDARETEAVWQSFINDNKDSGPHAFCLSRQNLTVLEETQILESDYSNVEKGAYTLIKEESPHLTLVATGSEVALAIDVAKQLKKMHYDVQVVSMPSWEKFNLQEQDYKDSVIPWTCPSISIEAGSTMGWSQFTDLALGIDTFGTSAKPNHAFEHFHFTKEKILQVALEVISITEEE